MESLLFRTIPGSNRRVKPPGSSAVLQPLDFRNCSRSKQSAGKTVADTPRTQGQSMYDALILSDIHLGSHNCAAKELVGFLEDIQSRNIPTEKLILNGDVFDSFDFRRLNKSHWKVLSLIRKMSDQLEIVWINGNHDGPSEIFSHLLGVQVLDDMILESGCKRILVHHGHRFDDFIDRHPLVTACADLAYRWLQRLDRSHVIARTAKRRSKVFLRCTDKIRTRSTELAEKLGCNAVCCGHTHLPVIDSDSDIEYYNSGCWTERPCHYLTVKDGLIELHQHAREEVIALWQEETSVANLSV